MSNRFTMPLQTVLDTNGDPVSGAKINAYKTGTVTRLDTYSDDALTTANANPIVADSAGRFEAPFLKDEDYKFVITDSADVEIGTYDPVRGGVDNLADDTIRSALDSGGSANAYTLTVNRTFSAYANGQEFTFKANHTNTGAATLNVTPGDSGASALGAKSIKKHHDLALESGDIESGQWVTVRYDGTNFQLVTPNRKTGVQQFVSTNSGSGANGAVATGTTVIPLDDTIPQNTEGDEYITASITPTDTNSTLIIDVQVNCSHSSVLAVMTAALFQDSTADALAVGYTQGANTGGQRNNIAFRHVMTAGTTSATTFKLRVGANNAGTTTINGSSTSREFGLKSASKITIMEILP